MAILQDLGGPKIRTGPARGRTRRSTLKAGDALRIATGDFVGGPGRVSTTFAGLARERAPGDRLLLADGRIELRVESTDGDEIQTTVVEGGELGEHKGINAPGVPLPASAITPKDVDDLRFGLSLGVDMVALSFVQTAADLRQARRAHRLTRAARDVPLDRQARTARRRSSISTRFSTSCDAVMVARGDLGPRDAARARAARAEGDHARARARTAFR